MLDTYAPTVRCQHRSRLVISRLLFTIVVGSVMTPAERNAYSAEEKPVPNIMVILADDLGYGDLSCYGAKDLQSPNIDALVASGMRLDPFYANCPVCSPTRAALLTGRFQELVGVPGVIRTHPENNWGYLAEDALLLPVLLRRSGYTSAIIGKWHLGLEAPNLPNLRGFDYFAGFLGDMMDDYYLHRRHGFNYMRRNEKEIDPQGHATDLFTEWACEYVHQQAQADRPFFLYLAYNAPHTPIQPPEDWLQRVKKREQGISDKRAKLVALIEHLDAGVGQVLNALKESGQADDTLVIFTSDNGGQLSAGANNGPLRDGKQSMYEGGLRVPTCAVWPGRIAAGSRSGGAMMSMDLFATACDAAGVNIDHPIDGVSLLPVLVGKGKPPENRDLFFHRREGGARYEALTTSAMRRGDWKLVRNSPFTPLELFHVSQDPQEKVDLAGKAVRQFRDMAAALRTQVQRGGAAPWQPPARRDTRADSLR